MFLKRLSPRTLFSLTPSSLWSPYSIFIAQCSSSSPSNLTYPHSHSHPDPTNVRVSVWWDLDNCSVPPGVNVFRGVQAITAAIESSGIKGPIQITAFSDMLRLAKTNKALSSTGIKVTHIPYGGEFNVSVANRSLFIDLMFWVSQNPPPAHLFIITVDRGSSSILHRLRMNKYNILLATKESAPAVLRSAATIMWNWDHLVRGKELTGRYFNRPPKCPWYDHYDGPLEDPFPKIESFGDPEPELFSHDSFWRDMNSFFKTTRGSFILEEANKRREMLYYLEKYGPSVLKSLPDYDVLRMMDIWISENLNDWESPYNK